MFSLVHVFIFTNYFKAKNGCGTVEGPSCYTQLNTRKDEISVECGVPLVSASNSKHVFVFCLSSVLSPQSINRCYLRNNFDLTVFIHADVCFGSLYTKIGLFWFIVHQSRFVLLAHVTSSTGHLKTLFVTAPCINPILPAT